MGASEGVDPVRDPKEADLQRGHVAQVSRAAEQVRCSLEVPLALLMKGPSLLGRGRVAAVSPRRRSRRQSQEGCKPCRSPLLPPEARSDTLPCLVRAIQKARRYLKGRRVRGVCIHCCGEEVSGPCSVTAPGLHHRPGLPLQDASLSRAGGSLGLGAPGGPTCRVLESSGAREVASSNRRRASSTSPRRPAIPAAEKGKKRLLG